MKPVSRSVVLQLVAAAMWAVGLQAQDCPRASGPDAEEGWQAYSDDDMERARARFEAALATCPGDGYARTGLGYVFLRGGNVDGASSLWRDVVTAEPNNVDALTGLGLAAWRRGDLDDVRARFERVVLLVPDHATALEYLELVDASAATPPPDAADDAWARGDTDEALELYRARLRESPEDATAALRVALILAWRGEYDTSLELLDTLLERVPAQVDARVARARVHAWAGDIPAAQREVLEVLAVQPDNAEALEALGLFQAWSGNLEGALDTYDELISIAPQSGVAGRQRAQTLAWASQYEAATGAYEALLSRDPSDVEARLGLAQALSYAQEFDASVAQYDLVLAVDPTELRALIGKAKALGWAGDLVAAEYVAVEAVSRDRSSAAAWAQLGQIYRWEGRNADAKGALDAAAGLAPTDADVLDQVRSLGLTFAPLARPTVVSERASDDNRMNTFALTGSWHPTPRLDVRAHAYYRDLRQGVFQRWAGGTTVVGHYELSRGWMVTGGVGGSRTDGADDPSFLEYQAGIRSPERHRWVGAVNVSSAGLNETAALADRGVRKTELLATGRWPPGVRWRFDGTVGVGSFEGSEPNGRRSASLSLSRRVGRFFALGASVRGFSFEKDLDDGYFDPDFYGLAEATTHWLYRPGPWTLLAEVAPGAQQIGSEGDVRASLRTNVKIAYGLGPGREVSASFGYSSAGLTSFATGGSGYTYTALIVGSSWTF